MAWATGSARRARSDRSGVVSRPGEVLEVTVATPTAHVARRCGGHADLMREEGDTTTRSGSRSNASQPGRAAAMRRSRPGSSRARSGRSSSSSTRSRSILTTRTSRRCCACATCGTSRWRRTSRPRTRSSAGRRSARRAGGPSQPPPAASTLVRQGARQRQMEELALHTLPLVVAFPLSSPAGPRPP